MIRRILAPVILLTAAACGSENPPPEAARPARVVRTAAVIDTSMASSIEATGVLAARDETDLSFTGGGVVAEVLVRPGDRVRAGQMLARLDAAEVEARLASAEALLAKAVRDLARAERLLVDSVVTRSTVDDARTARDAAQAVVDAARFARRTAVITAPAAGTILARHVDPGSVVSAGAAVVRFGGTAGGTVFRAALPDRDVLRVQVGDVATVVLDAAREERLTGRVVEVAAAPSAGTGTWQVEVALDGAATLPRGLTGVATIRGRRTESVRLIPIAAVVEADASRGIVFTLEDGVARRHEVALGAIDGAAVTVRHGLPAGRRVITAGASWLADGDAVTEAEATR